MTVKKLLTAYCLSYGNWTVIPRQWERVFADMRECGFDAVDLSFSESEERYAMRTFEQQVRLAHRCGLKVLAIPSRIGGRLAGAPFMAGYWLVNHPEAQVPGHPGLGCLESPEFNAWSEGFIRMMAESFDIDGIIWDEPKGVDTICMHPATLARFGPNPTREDMYKSSLDYLTRLTATAKRIRPELNFTIFNMPGTPSEFTAACGRIPGIDYTGFDGTCCEQSFFHEPPRRFKPTVRQMWARTCREAAGSRTGTFALIENMLIPDSELAAYEEELAATLREVSPDHLSCYYYGHNNQSAERIQRRTMNMIKKSIKEVSHAEYPEIYTH